MSKQLNGFNGVATFYDIAKRIVFGKAIYRSKTHFLGALPSDPKILIVGGGSGETLPLLLQLYPHCRIWFIDASSEMLQSARRRMKGKSPDAVRFIHGTKDMLPEGILYDAVITDFLLDLFPDQEVSRTAHHLARHLQPGGVWLIADFVEGGPAWQKMLLWLMYRLFSLACGIEAKRMPSWPDIVTSAGMEEVSAATFYAGFIRSTVYRKSGIPRL